MRHYKYEGRGGHHWVDQLRPDEGGGVYGNSLLLPSRNSAELVAGALNDAYAAGLREGAIAGAVNSVFTERPDNA